MRYDLWPPDNFNPAPVKRKSRWSEIRFNVLMVLLYGVGMLVGCAVLYAAIVGVSLLVQNIF